MLVRFWGTRGSIAKPGPSTIRYGGNTSCVEIRSAAGTLVVIDCGTGAHGLGQALMAAPAQAVNGHLLISHTHWDHIQGIPFFAPLFLGGNKWDIYAPQSLSQSIRDTLAGQMQYTYFPVSIEALGADIHYHDLVEGVLQIGDITVRSVYLNHPALTLGYRLEADGVAIVYACDHEPFAYQPDADKAGFDMQDRRHADFLRGADLVMHDAQYTAAEYPDKVGWGHSTAEYAVDICSAAGVKKLVLTHHDPTRDDEAVDQIVSAMRGRVSARGQALQVCAAAEGETIDLGTSAHTATGHTATAPGNTALSALTRSAARLADYSILLSATDAQTAEVIAAAAAGEKVSLLRAGDTRSTLQYIQARQASLLVLDEQAVGAEAFEICRKFKESMRQPLHPEQVSIVIITDRRKPAAELLTFTAEWLRRGFSQEYARTRIRAWILRTGCRWARAQLPEHEEARLAAINRMGILDSAPEERFDRIVRIAAASFDVPIALFSLVDRDRQWFKSGVGLGVQETSRDMAFCAHAILQDDVMIVPDALLDPRFADNPLVIGEPRVRFYAGCPVLLADGNIAGTLCLIDVRPRWLDASKVDLLRDLAKLIETELARGA